MRIGTNSESNEQVSLFEWCEYSSGKYPELQLLFHVPNGGYRSKATAGRMKAEGVKAGVPDLFLPVAKQGYHGLFIEMKAGKNKPTAHQMQWLEHLSQQGYLAVVCYGWEDAAKALTEYLDEVPMK
ncbi:MAG: VRR-NUC domain-containing protein [Ruminococcaceae bacterium]|nr:VRR-NUC domain-containing protein [Oscillospiraceae bacterium]